MQITVNRRTVLLTLWTIVTLLAIGNVAGIWLKYEMGHDTLFGLIPLFDFNREGNLPAFFSACLLLLVAALFFVISGDAWTRGDRWRRHWLGLAAISLFLAVDEAAELHGILSRPLRNLGDLSGALFFGWVVPYAILTIIVTIVYWLFWLALPPRPRMQLALAASLYVLGAIGFEVLSGIIVSEYGGLQTGLDTWQHAIAYTAEELLEMSGTLLAIRALLQYIAEHRITFEARMASD
jgi:hypothetical protein